MRLISRIQQKGGKVSLIDRKFANHPGWKRVLQHRFYHTYLDTPEFKGTIAFYCMDAVREPLVVAPTMEVDLLDADDLLAARESGDITTTEFHFSPCP